ncbi:MAG TPA: hypothetical protein VHH73_19430, partial [Verrucomicrobiae bacterium]|nr:hypothetical protein [Verrucomicrobiae bacterium]
MSELHIIETALDQAARRRRWLRGWRGLWRGLLAAGSCWLLAVLIYKLLPVSPVIFYYAGGLAAACVAGGFLSGWWRANTLPETARWLDSQKRLEERLSTALEVAKQEKASNWRDLIIRDAARHAEGLDVRGLLPYRLPGISRWALLMLLLAAGLGFVPEYRSKEFLEKKKDAQNIKETGRQMAELVR